MQKKKFSIVVLFLSALICFQASGSVVLSGNSSDKSLRRLINQSVQYDGLLDNTFGNTGTNYINGSIFGDGPNYVKDSALQEDGKIVLVGFVQNGGDNDFIMARFTSDGQLDPSFGINNPNSAIPGTVYINQSLGGIGTTSVFTRAYAVVIQSDGKIVVAGSSNSTTNQMFMLARYTSAGDLDTTFGAGSPYSIVPGTIYVPAGIAGDGGTYDEAYAVTLQTDGKIIVAGTSTLKFALARFTSDGLLDSTFGAESPYSNINIPGTVYIPAPIAGGTPNADDGDQAQSVAIQSDGKIVVSGFSQTTTGHHFVVARLTTDGLLDETFGQNNSYSVVTGTVYIPAPLAGGTLATQDQGDQAWGLALQNDGAIVLGGFSQNGLGSSFAAARFTVSGYLDTTFGVGNPYSTRLGTVYIPSPIAGGNGTDDEAYAVALQVDGSIVVGGLSDDGLHRRFALARLTPQGVLDSSFGTVGYNSHLSGTVYIAQSLTVEGVNSSGKSVMIQSNGNIIMTGLSYVYFALARFFNPLDFDSYQSSYSKVGAGLIC